MFFITHGAVLARVAGHREMVLRMRCREDSSSDVATPSGYQRARSREMALCTVLGDSCSE